VTFKHLSRDYITIMWSSLKIVTSSWAKNRNLYKKRGYKYRWFCEPRSEFYQCHSLMVTLSFGCTTHFWSDIRSKTEALPRSISRLGWYVVECWEYHLWISLVHIHGLSLHPKNEVRFILSKQKWLVPTGLCHSAL